MTVEAFVFDAYGTLYDVQSVSQLIDEEFPEHSDLITQVWRLKQLEYTWLRSLMGSYRSFWDISEESLTYTLDSVGLKADKVVIDRIMDKYLHLDPHSDCRSALEALQGTQLAILSNGNQEILDDLVRNTGLDSQLDAVISVDKAKIFKPHPRAYELVEQRLKMKPCNTVFVTSNAFDACGAKSYGFQVAWIERVTQCAMAREIEKNDMVAPSTMFKILRMQMENLDIVPDYRLSSLNELAKLVN